jgi:hypothetical protein
MSAGRTGSVPGSGPAAAGSLEAHSVPDPNRGIEETGQPKLNAQSPSGRGDGDCALSYSIPIRFDFISWPPNITELAGSGSRRTATG